MPGDRQEVLATCRALARGQPTPTKGVTFDTEAFREDLRTERTSWESSLAELWERDVPDAVRDDKRAAEAATARFMDSCALALDPLEQQLPDRFDSLAAARRAQRVSADVAAPATSRERAMSALGVCAVYASGDGGWLMPAARRTHVDEYASQTSLADPPGSLLAEQLANGRCLSCLRSYQRQRDQARNSAAQRGYGRDRRAPRGDHRRRSVLRRLQHRS